MRVNPAVLLLGIALVANTAGAQTPAPAASPNVVIERDVPATTRDGVMLRADIYRPNRLGTFP